MSMLKKPLARILIVSSFLFLLGVVALAAAGRKNGVVLSADHRTTIATHPSGHVVAPPPAISASTPTAYTSAATEKPFPDRIRKSAKPSGRGSLSLPQPM